MGVLLGSLQCSPQKPKPQDPHGALGVPAQRTVVLVVEDVLVTDVLVVVDVVVLVVGSAVLDVLVRHPSAHEP